MTESDHLDRISQLENRVQRLEKILTDRLDVIHDNFEGYEDIAEEEERDIELALKQLSLGELRTSDLVFNELE